MVPSWCSRLGFTLVSPGTVCVQGHLGSKVVGHKKCVVLVITYQRRTKV